MMVKAPFFPSLIRLCQPSTSLFVLSSSLNTLHFFGGHVLLLGRNGPETNNTYGPKKYRPERYGPERPVPEVQNSDISA
jgi:hypothetical protein